jgi:hypothetical protein
MSYIESFQSFHLRNMGIDYDDLFSLQENKSQAKYSFQAFKNYFSDFLLESEGYIDESLLENSFAFYECSMLYEAKSHWFEGTGIGNSDYLDCGTHALVIKDGEGFLIEKITFNKINEWLTMDDIHKAWGNLKKSAGNAWDKGDKIIKSAGKAISYGAEKAWGFLKSCGNAIVKFVKGMTFLEWAALAFSLLSAVLGIAGAAAGAVTGIGAALIPIGGACQIIAGGIHLYEGWHRYDGMIKSFGKGGITPAGKFHAALATALPEGLVGTLLLLLGINDVITGIGGIVDPSAGSRAVATNTSAKMTLQGFLKAPGAAMEKAIEGLAEGALKKVGISLSHAAAEGMAKVGTTVFATVAPAILSKMFTWLFKSFLETGNMITKGIDGLINIPAKISDGITKFQKGAKGGLAEILAKGLSTVVKPMTDCAAKVIKKSVQPIVDKVKNWFKYQLQAYDKNKKMMEEYMHGLHTVEKHKQDKYVKAIFTVKNISKELSKNEISLIKTASGVFKNVDGKKDKNNKGKKGKVKESQIWEMSYLKSFDDLEFI